MYYPFLVEYNVLSYVITSIHYALERYLKVLIIVHRDVLIGAACIIHIIFRSPNQHLALEPTDISCAKIPYLPARHGKEARKLEMPSVDI